MGEHDELLADFITEALEILDGYDEELVSLEHDPTQEPLIHSIFRRVHNIKGMCGFLHFTNLEALSHAGEDLLTALRRGACKLNTHHTDLLLQLGDTLRATLTRIQSDGKDAGVPHLPLIDALRSALAEDPSCEAASLCDGGAHAFGATAARSGGAPTTPLLQPSAAQADSSLRVEITLLDQLMNLAGELVLARNQILQLTKTHPDPTFRSIVEKLNSVTSELQEGVMKTRVQPISLLCDKLPRIVRDVTHETGKQVAFTVTGGETELDRAILEAIKDPLIHLIRNAIDHGIESAESRRAAGKSAQGALSLQAFPDGGYVIIELRDDGAGLNTQKIKQRAVTQGLLTAKQADGMSDSQIHRLIFTPGFSTADAVTHLSGRGVGMDVVRSNIEAISGQVQVMSESGRGTTMRLKIPMTLSIIPTLLVSSGGETFAIPEASVLELVKLSPESMLHPVIEVGSSTFIRLREQLLPLVNLSRYLELPRGTSEPEGQIALVLCVDGCRFGVVVDEVHDIEEIVVKSLDSRLQSLGLYAGATILGDGRIVLIVDPTGMLHFLQLHRPDEVDSFGPASRDAEEPRYSPSEAFLLTTTDMSSCTAIPLSYVARLEKVPTHTLLSIGGTLTLQYRGSVLPVIKCAHSTAPSSSQEDIPIVILRCTSEQEVGLWVDSIVDISTAPLPTQTVVSSPHSMTLGIIDTQTAILLDVPALCQSALGLSTQPPPKESYQRGTL